MSKREDSKGKKVRKIKEPEPSKMILPPERAQRDFAKTPILRDLSPMSPFYQTIKKTYDNSLINSDLAIIETPVGSLAPKSLIEEVDARYHTISKILVWEEQEHNQRSEEFGEISQDSQQMIEASQNQYKINQCNSANKIQEINEPHEALLIQKAGQKIKSAKQNKKREQKVIKIEESEPKRKITCNCKKTKCLKLYCDCFHQNQVCGPSCHCIGCHNTDEFQEQRYNAMLSLIQRNPEAFKPKLEPEQHAKGCNCKKSGCTKKYCECFQAGLGCGKNCKCEQCKNGKPMADDQPSQSAENTKKKGTV